MNLKYIALGLNRDQFSDDYRYNFELHTRFISNYFSKLIRKIKYKTDESYDMISINGAIKIENTIIVPLNVINVNIPFNQVRYEQIKGTDDYSYYLELLEQGFIKASEFKPIPIETLLSLIKDFKSNDCRNEWLFKKRKFTEHDLEIILTCEFTTNFFQLIITINQISTRKELVTGILMKTEPDEIFFDKMFKDIYIEDDIIITDSSDSPRVIISKRLIFENILKYKIKGDKNIQAMLSYKL